MCKCQYAHSKKKYFSKLDTKYPKDSNGIGKTVALNYSYVLYHNGAEQRFSTDMLWQARCCAARIFKYVVPDYLVRDTGLFSLRLSIEKKKKDNSQHNNSCQCEWIKIIPIFGRSTKKILLVISLCVSWDEKGWKLLA